MFVICRETQMTLNSKAILRKENGAGGIRLPDLKLHYRYLPGGPVVRNPPSRAGGKRLIAGRETGIPHAVEQLSLCPATTDPACHSSKSPHRIKRINLQNAQAAHIAQYPKNKQLNQKLGRRSK